METIVVGVDESKGAAAALEWAVAEAQLRSCPLRVVMCWGYLDQHHGPGDPTTFDPSYVL
jgi:nucleotide-binding universal stress UspA family protein